jgi:hypothetical protein
MLPDAALDSQHLVVEEALYFLSNAKLYGGTIYQHDRLPHQFDVITGVLDPCSIKPFKNDLQFEERAGDFG